MSRLVPCFNEERMDGQGGIQDLGSLAALEYSTRRRGGNVRRACFEDKVVEHALPFLANEPEVERLIGEVSAAPVFVPV